jgi:hypothetical protein
MKPNSTSSKTLNVRIERRSMSKIKTNQIRPLMGFTGLSYSELAALSSAVENGMSGNPAYPNPPVDMAVFKAAVESFAAAIVRALGGGQQALADRDRERVVVIKALRQLGPYVQAQCHDDMAVFTSSGFQAASTTRLPPQPLSPPDVRKIDQGVTGQLLVRITSVAGARTYELRYAALAGATPGPWTTEVLVKTKGATPVNGLTPGTTYAFQVRALNKLGYTNWSDPTSRMCI